MSKYGFVYLWFDRKHKRYYVGCHWGTEDDGYICSSQWMHQSIKYRPQDFKRRILKTNIQHRPDMYKAAAISAAKKAKNRKFTDEHKEKLRQAKLGKKLTPEHRAKVIKTLKYCKGLTL